MEFSDLTKRIEAIRVKMRDQAERRALRAGAEVIRDAMEVATPVQAARNLGSDSLETGELKENICVSIRTEDGQPYALIGPMGKGGRIGKAAHLVEYGHRMVTGGKSRLNAAGQFVGGGTVVGDVPAHPFLRPAFESSAAPAVAEVAAVYGEELRKAAS